MDQHEKDYERDGETPTVACTTCGGSGHRCADCLGSGLSVVQGLQLREARAVATAA